MKTENGNIRVISKEENRQYNGMTIDDVNSFSSEQQNNQSYKYYRKTYDTNSLKFQKVFTKGSFGITAKIIILLLLTIFAFLVFAIPALVIFTVVGLGIWLINKLKRI